MKRILPFLVALALILSCTQGLWMSAFAITPLVLDIGTEQGTHQFADGNYYQSLYISLNRSTYAHCKYTVGGSTTYQPNKLKVLSSQGSNTYHDVYWYFINSSGYDGTGDEMFSLENILAYGSTKLEFLISGSITTSNKTCTAKLYMKFYDASGTLLTTNSTSKSLSSGYTAVSFSISTTVDIPDGAMYVVPYVNFYCTTNTFSLSASSISLYHYKYVPLPAETPVFESDAQQNYTYTVGDGVEPLFASASVSDGGTLTYQWFSSEYPDDMFVAILGANSAKYFPDVSEIGTKYYCCRVTNTKDESTASATSPTYSVVVAGPDAPLITTDLPSSVSYVQGDTASPLAVQATLTSAGTLSYQWYGGVSGYGWPVPINGATSATFTPPTDYSGYWVYYCEVTNTLNGYTSKTVTSMCAFNVGTQHTFGPEPFKIINFRNYITVFDSSGSYDILTVEFPLSKLYTNISYEGSSQGTLVGSAWYLAYNGMVAPETPPPFSLSLFPMGCGSEMENVLSLDELPNGSVGEFSFGGISNSVLQIVDVSLCFHWYDEEFNQLGTSSAVAELASENSFAARYSFDAPDEAAYCSYCWVVDGYFSEDFTPLDFELDTSSVVFTVQVQSGISDKDIDELKDQIGSIGNKVDGIQGSINDTNNKLDGVQGSIDQTNDKLDGVQDSMNDANEKLEDIISGGQAGADLGAAGDQMDENNNELGGAVGNLESLSGGLPTMPQDLHASLGDNLAHFNAAAVGMVMPWNDEEYSDFWSAMFTPTLGAVSVALLLYFVFGKARTR